MDNNLSELIHKAKSTIKTPIQEVKVVPNKKKSKNEGSLQIAFYIPKELYKRVKKLAFEQDASIKSILNQSIENYLKDIS